LSLAVSRSWSDPERKRPVGDPGCREPYQVDAIIGSELERGLDDPDSPRDIAQLASHWQQRSCRFRYKLEVT
jgi:hypothetical protein